MHDFAFISKIATAPEGMRFFGIWHEDIPAVIEKLRVKAKADYKARISIDKLDAAHREVLIRAINNVLATENAIFTYAQIIDGLPIGDVAFDRRNPGLFGDHPLDGEHEQLCPGALDKARQVCPKWDPAMLAFDPRVINAFQRAAPGTKMFNTRLIEMVAVALHQFGVLLHQLELRMHQGEHDIEYYINWTVPKPDDEDDNWEPWKPLPTIFHNPYYQDWKIYPEGVADMVGYWAEDRILGGVVLFDRRAELDADGNLTGEPPNIYLHPSRENSTFRITQLLDWQQQALVDFLLAAKPGQDEAAAAAPGNTDTPPIPCPIPVLVDDRNRTRVDPEEALVFRGVYRDIWERMPAERDEWHTARRRPKNQIDYPELAILGLMANYVAGDALPEGKLKRYLEGRETIPEGPTKRWFDEYKEAVASYEERKRTKLAAAPEKDEGKSHAGDEGGAEEGEKEQGLAKEEEKEEGVEEGVAKEGEKEEEKEGDEKKGQEKKGEDRKFITVDTWQSLERFLSGEEEHGSDRPAS